MNGDNWAVCIEVEDKGNVAIFNPYCVDPYNVISFYVRIYHNVEFLEIWTTRNLAWVIEVYQKIRERLFVVEIGK